jgi:hypothetical protein
MQQSFGKFLQVATSQNAIRANYFGTSASRLFSTKALVSQRRVIFQWERVLAPRNEMRPPLTPDY